MQYTSILTAAIHVFVNEFDVWFVWKEKVTKKWIYSHCDTYPVINALKKSEAVGLEQMRKTGNEKQSAGLEVNNSYLFIADVENCACARTRVCVYFVFYNLWWNYLQKYLQYYTKLRQILFLHSRLGVL